MNHLFGASTPSLLVAVGLAYMGVAQPSLIAFRGEKKLQNSILGDEHAAAHGRRLACDDEVVSILADHATNPFAGAASAGFNILADQGIVQFEMKQCGQYVTLLDAVGIEISAPAKPEGSFDPLCVRYDGTSWTTDGLSIAPATVGNGGAMICETMHSHGYYAISWIPVSSTTTTSGTTSTTSATATSTTATATMTATTPQEDENDEGGSASPALAVPLLVVLWQISVCLP